MKKQRLTFDIGQKIWFKRVDSKFLSLKRLFLICLEINFSIIIF
jgi:hypothetical protein